MPSAVYAFSSVCPEQCMPLAVYALNSVCPEQCMSLAVYALSKTRIIHSVTTKLISKYILHIHVVEFILLYLRISSV